MSLDELFLELVKNSTQIIIDKIVKEIFFLHNKMRSELIFIELININILKLSEKSAHYNWFYSLLKRTIGMRTKNTIIVLKIRANIFFLPVKIQFPDAIII